MRLPPPKLPPANSLVIGSAFAMFGPRVPPGTYTAKLVAGDQSYSGRVELVPDPRTAHSDEDRALQHETAVALYGMLGRLTYVADTVKSLEDSAAQRVDKLPAGDKLRPRLTALARDLEGFRATLVATSEGGWLSGEEQLREKTAKVYGLRQRFRRPSDEVAARPRQGALRPARPGRRPPGDPAGRRGSRRQPGARKAQARAAADEEPGGMGEGRGETGGGAACLPAVLVPLLG